MAQASPRKSFVTCRTTSTDTSPTEMWPGIDWSVGAVTTGTANGVAYQERAITGTIDTSGYAAVRNAPIIQARLRTPLDKAGQPVPVVIVFGGTNSEWQFTAPYGYGVCALQLRAASAGQRGREPVQLPDRFDQPGKLAAPEGLGRCMRGEPRPSRLSAAEPWSEPSSRCAWSAVALMRRPAFGVLSDER